MAERGTQERLWRKEATKGGRAQPGRVWNALLRRMPGLAPEGSREPVQQGRDIVEEHCVKLTGQTGPSGLGRAGGNKQVQGEAVVVSPNWPSQWGNRDSRAKGG